MESLENQRNLRLRIFAYRILCILDKVMDDLNHLSTIDRDPEGLSGFSPLNSLIGRVEGLHLSQQKREIYRLGVGCRQSCVIPKFVDHGL